MSDIYERDRNPGDVLDEAIESRFNLSGNDLTIAELERIANGAHYRLRQLPASGIRICVTWLSMAMFPRANGIPKDKREFFSKFARIIFSEGETEDDLRIGLGTYLGGLLGYIILLPFTGRFQFDCIGSGDVAKIAHVRQWADNLVNIAGALPPELAQQRESLDPLLNLGWPRSTDFLLKLSALEGPWFYEEHTCDDTLQDYIYDQIRLGAKLAVWESGGRYHVSPSCALSPALFRDHNFNRGAVPAQWDICTSLLPLSDEGHAAHWWAVSAFPAEYFLLAAFSDAQDEQQWELAEALASLWLLQCFLLQPECGPPGEQFLDQLRLQRDIHSRQYGFLVPTCRHLSYLSATEEYRSEEWSAVLADMGKIIVADSRISPVTDSLKSSAARSELVSSLIGPVFMEFPADIKSMLVDVVLKHRLLKSHAGKLSLRHYGGETVALISPLEHLLRMRLESLSQATAKELDSAGLKLDPSKRNTLTLGAIVHLFKHFPRFSEKVQRELGHLFPALPLTRDQKNKLFTVFQTRNDGAHHDVALAQYDVAWNLLFTSSAEQARKSPGLYALLGKRSFT